MTTPVTMRRYERLDETVHELTLDDGLRVKVIPKPGFQKRYGMLTVGYGSIDNEFVPAGAEAPRHVPEGIAHFLEHKLFEDQAGDVFDQFARFGASANAYTTASETAYHFSTSSHFDECLDLLLDFVTDPYFTPEQIEKERQVIAQEIRMYEDDPDSVAQLNLLRALYHVHAVREDTAGTVESIQQIDKDLLELCHRTFYQPQNMLLALAGDFEVAEVVRRLEVNLERRRASRPGYASSPIVRVAPREPGAIREGRVEARMSVSQPRILIGFKDTPGVPGAETLRRTLETYLLNELLFGRSSAFYEAQYASGLIDPSFFHYYVASRGGYAYAVIGGETPEPGRLLDAVQACLEDAARQGLAEEDFRRIRNKVVGFYLRGFNSLEAMAGRETDAHFEGWDLLSYLDLLESVRLEDVAGRLGQLFRPERRAHSLLLPI